METEGHYAAVGAFILAVLATATLFVLWYSHVHESRTYRHYEVYFSSSVNGLNEGSTVNYLGVDVGRVERIGLDARDLQRVQVLLELNASTPIEPATVARLTLQGVTGLLSLDLRPAAANARGAGPAVPSERYPVILSEPSEIDQLLNDLPGLVAQSTAVAERLNRALSDDNLNALAATLVSARSATAQVQGASREISKLLVDTHELIRKSEATVANINAIVTNAAPDIEATAAKLHAMSADLASVAGRVDGLLARHQDNLERLAGQDLDDLHAIVRESRDTATELRSLARSLNEDPSRVLYQQPRRGIVIPP
jgi:phospholipid/cholesterol/gamma-HCH transport system substrate-binding protein